MSHPSVAVLMSTYNGEMYIEEQIESVLNQKDVTVTLYVRDDGSSDRTVEIVHEYAKRARVCLMRNGRNLRPGMSFMKLLYAVVKKERAYDYYAFADQDDIWLTDKLHSAIDMMKDSDEPLLYGSNQRIYRNGNIEGVRYPQTPDLTLLGHIATNTVSGCTMVMNRNLAEIVASLKCPDREFLTARCHDSWIYLIACAAGRVIYDDNAYIQYRIHESNAVGIRQRSLHVRIKKFLCGSVRNMRMLSAQYLIAAFPDVEFPDRQYVEKIAYYQRSLSDRIALIKCRKKCKTTLESELVFTLKVLFSYI